MIGKAVSCPATHHPSNEDVKVYFEQEGAQVEVFMVNSLDKIERIFTIPKKEFGEIIEAGKEFIKGG